MQNLKTKLALFGYVCIAVRPNLVIPSLHPLKTKLVMNFPGILTRYQGRCSSLLPRSLSHSTRLWVIASRNYVTHRDSINLDTGSSTLAQSLNGKQTRSSPSHDSVGPFQLGLSQSALRNGEKVKKWSELSSTGKGGFNLKLNCNIHSLMVSYSYALNCSYYKLYRHLTGGWTISAPCLFSYDRIVFQKFADSPLRGRLRAHKILPSGKLFAVCIPYFIVQQYF